MAPNPVSALAAWIRARAHLMLTQAPRETPILLIVVLVVGFLVLGLYALAWQLDLAVVGWWR